MTKRKSKYESLIGQKFGRLLILSMDTERERKGKKYFKCLCDCGNEKSILTYSVTGGNTTSCGCLAKEINRSRKGEKLKDITGQRYGRLVALYRSHQKNYVSHWMCRCDCGNEKTVAINQLTIGKTKSCGCLNRELSSKRMKGENHPFYGVRGEQHHKWNPNLTDEERHDKRDTVENYHFRNNVFKRDDYTCQCCGNRSSKNNSVTLNVHHIYNYSDNKDKRYDVDNGVTLCEPCHKDFHKKYGRENNNKDQLNEFIKDNTEVTNSLKAS